MAEAMRQDAGKSRRGAETRRDILEVARRMFGEHGYSGTSMAEIAAGVGVVEGALYKHFPGKRELLLEATRACLQPRFDAARAQLGGVTGTRNRLRFVIWCHLRMFIDDPGICRLVIQEIRPFDDYQGSAVRSLLRGHSDVLIGILEDAAHAGELRESVQPAVVRDLVFGGVEHLAFRVLRGSGTIDADALADELTDVVLRGVCGVYGADARDGAGVPDVQSVSRLQLQVDRLTSVVDALQRELSKDRKK